MFRHSSTPSYGGDAYMAALATVPTQIPRSAAAGGYLDGSNASGAFPPFAAASSPPSYSSSLPSSYYNNIHRSISSHSLPLQVHQLGDALNGGAGGAFFSSSSLSPHQLSSLPPLSSSPSSSCGGDLYEFNSSCPVRRVFSTGDLQGMNGSSPVQSGDSYGQDVGGPFSQKVGRYSAEERKERVERYRLKRHQRNFTKKITYACRKSLADSRPRVKGRFARNGEAEAENYDEREASDNSYDYSGYSEPSTGNSCYRGKESSVAGTAALVGDNGEWWWRAPGATVEVEGQRQVGFDVGDEELWATLGDMLSVNLAS